MESYLFVRVVGKGSYGEVNLVKHKSDRKQYVIKKLNLRTSSKRERRAAEQEAQLLSQLKHPNIVTYRESWEGEDCQLYIVMGFCEGGDLYHRLKQQKGDLLPERQVVEWFVQIAMALQYLHEKHILHRDLKTQNIFLTKTNIIKVGDLGIARVLENQYDMASTLIGTPYYMSPELFSNKPYNYKSDVWALGCCVYEMATLKHAFNAKDMNSLVYRIVEGKLPQMPGRYAPQLGELIKRMLCKRPEDRPDVKHILRQPYIKQQISIFLEATKEKTAKSRKKAPNSRANSAGPSVPANHQLGIKTKQKLFCFHEQKLCNGVRDVISPDSLLPPKSLREDIFNSTGQSVVTISNIDVAIQPKGKLKEAKPPRPKPASKPHSAPEQREREEGGTPMPKQLSGVCSGEGESAFPSKNPSTQEPPDLIDRTGFLKKGVAPGVGVAMEEDTLTLLRQGPVEDDAPGPRHTPFTDLKTENLSLAEAALKEKYSVLKQEQKSSWQESDEEECSSSTSSTERWEGDYREGKSETNEMQDLVQMMTQTLRMDARDVSCEQEDSHCHSDTLPEFRLNRKYRDTLMLHGKAQEGEANFPSDDSSGQAKIRRAIEHLRTDVLKGLGVKLLNKVLDIMQEEDEDRREVLLRQQMGEEKYKLYAVMVRQLKFFEDVTFRD
uniref:Serine/threonine-protein kinase Nek4 n=1 Tax=Electrophorus electricus TaxID=8005 RepID=A0AAY5F410_ELEEL